MRAIAGAIVILAAAIVGSTGTVLAAHPGANLGEPLCFVGVILGIVGVAVLFVELRNPPPP